MRAYGMTQCPSIRCPVSVLRASGFSSSQEPLGQFQPNLVGNMPGEWGFTFAQIKGLHGHFWGPNKGQNKENFDKPSKIVFS